MDDLLHRPLSDLVDLLPILQQRQDWLSSQQARVDAAIAKLTTSLSTPLQSSQQAPHAAPESPVAFLPCHPLPPNPPDWLVRFHSTATSHPRIMSLWCAYASQKCCTSWSTITYDMLASFAVSARQYVAGVPNTGWRPQFNWLLSLVQTFNADTIIDGGPPPPEFSQTYVSLNPDMQSISSVPMWSTTAATTPNVNSVWCVQPSTTVEQSQWLPDRLHAQLPTTVLLVVPVGHTLNTYLQKHPSIETLSVIPKFSVLPQSFVVPSCPYSHPVTLYLAHVGQVFSPHHLVSMLGPICRQHSAVLQPLPSHWNQPTSRQRIRDLFWSKWHAQTAHVRDTSDKWSHTDWCTFLQQRANLLSFAPQPWLRRLWNFRRHRQCQDFSQKGTWVYALFSVSTKRVYVGQTGAFGLPKPGVTRFRQHLRACRSYTTLYGMKHCRDLGSIYPMMSRTSFENWGMVLLEHCTPGNALRLERSWIRRLTPTLNVRDVPVYSRKWELLLRGKMASAPSQRQSLNSCVQSILHSRRQTTPLAHRLAILSRVKKYFSSGVANQVFQKVQHQVHQNTGLKIRQRMPINVPTLRHIEPRIVRDNVASFVSHLPIPQCLREYYGRVLTIVAKRHTCVRDVLCTRKITLSFTEIQDAAAEPCNCAAIAARYGLPLLDGHIMARRPAHLRKIFGAQTPIITQDLKCEPVVPWWMAKNIVTSSLKRLLLSLPVHSVSDSASELYSTVLSHVHTAWCAERTIQPWYCRHEAIEKFRNDHPEFVFFAYGQK